MTERTRIQLVAVLAGVVFVVLGLLGFVPGFTTHYGRLAFVGAGSGAKLFAVFKTSILENLVHLGIGLAGLTLARTAAGAQRYLLGGGIACLLLWLLGVVDAGGWVPLNAPDNWLHLLLGVALLGLGFWAGRATAVAPEPA